MNRADDQRRRKEAKVRATELLMPFLGCTMSRQLAKEMIAILRSDPKLSELLEP